MQGITASCVIRDRIVLKDGKIIFEDKGGQIIGSGAGQENGNKEAGLGGFLLSLYEHLGLSYPRFYKMDQLSKLGWLAAEVLLKDRFRAEDYRAEEIGLVLANANASLDTDMKYFATVATIPSPSLFVYTLPNIMIGEICIRHGFKGESAFFVSERFDVDFMERYVRGLMEEKVLKACLYGWVDLVGKEGEAFLFLIEKGKG